MLRCYTCRSRSENGRACTCQFATKVPTFGPEGNDKRNEWFVYIPDYHIVQSRCIIFSQCTQLGVAGVHMSAREICGHWDISVESQCRAELVRYELIRIASMLSRVSYESKRVVSRLELVCGLKKMSFRPARVWVNIEELTSQISPRTEWWAVGTN